MPSLSYKNALVKFTNKKIGSLDPQSMKVNYYNVTMEPLTYTIQTLNNNTKILKKPSSTNQRNRYFLKQNANNNDNSSGYRTQRIIRKAETKAIEKMINKLNKNMPEYDINVVGNNNFFGMKEKK